MNLEQLTKFCAKSDIRPYLNKPWIHGECAVASNGHIAVRVPAEDFVSLVAQGTGKEPRVDALVEKAKVLGLTLMPIPELPPAALCQHCGGSGLSYPCDECDGSGSFNHRGREYECKACDGSGQSQTGEGDTEPCWNCDGQGELSHCEVRVGNGHFDRRYLAVIASLPNAAIAPNGPNGVAYFSFNGGDGALMPMRPSTTTKF